MLKEIVLPPIDMKKFSDQPIDSNLIIMSHDFNVNELVIPFYEANVFDSYEAFYSFQGNTSIIIQEVYKQNNEIRIPIVNDVRRHKGIFTIELNASSHSTQATLLKLNVMVKRSNIDSNSEFLFNHYYKLFEDYKKEIAELNNATQTTIKTQLKQSQDNLQKVTKTLVAINDKVMVVNNTADGFMTDVASKYNEFDTSVTQATQEITVQVGNTIANINTLASDFTADVATKQADVTSKYNAFDVSVTTANQTIDDILGLADDVQQVSTQVAEKVQNFKLKNEIVNGDFSQGTTGWAVFTVSIINAINGGLEWSKPGLPSIIRTNYYMDIVATQKYYIKTYVKGASEEARIDAYFRTKGTIASNITATADVPTSGVNYSEILTATTTVEAGLFFRDQDTRNTVIIDDVICINLTKIFGVGNEPTKLEMDELMKVIPNGWWDGELSLTQKQFVTWQLNLIRKNTNAIIALGGTIV